MCAQLLDFWPAWRLWRSVHFAPHLLMAAVMLTGLVMPPRRPKQREAAGQCKPGEAPGSGQQQQQQPPRQQQQQQQLHFDVQQNAPQPHSTASAVPVREVKKGL